MVQVMMTQSRLKELIVYEADTGLFYRFSKNKLNKSKLISTGTKNPDGYIRICINYKLYPAHHLAFLYMEGNLPDGCVDHINGVKDDNSWRNLRAATLSENQWNRLLPKNNKTGYIGVQHDKRSGKYIGRLKYKGKLIHLGTFKTALQASKARSEKAKQLHGEFYRECA